MASKRRNPGGVAGATKSTRKKRTKKTPGNSTPKQITKAIAKRRYAADLKRSGLTMADAKARGFKLLTPAQTRAKTKSDTYAGSYAWSYLIPYYDINGKLVKDYWRVRYLEDVVGAFGSKPEKPWRYSGPKGGRLRLYFDPTIDWSPIKGAE